MTHFGIICPAESGHLNTFIPLGKELLLRGHKVTVIASADARKKVITAGLEFKPIGEDILPLGSLKERFTELGQLSGLAALKYTIQIFKDSATSVLRDAPQVIKEARIEALLVDQTCSEGGTVAELLGIPFVTVCSSVVLNRDPDIPPFSSAWKYSPTWKGRLRNQLGYKILNRVVKPRYDVLTEYRQKWNLPLHSSVNSLYSPLAQISHQLADLEYPRTTLPNCFHFTGPYHYSVSRERVPFPWEKLTGQPLIYASMGTLQNRLVDVFEKIASACSGLDAQLVITLGGSATPESLPELPGKPLVVSYAPQLELLKKAALVITHAGMNTTLECLTNGVPMVAIPVTNDQPGIAARIAWTGAGEIVPLKKLSVERLQKAVKQVLTEDSYKKNALRLQEAIKRSGGVKKAADIIEQAVSTRKPVLA